MTPFFPPIDSLKTVTYGKLSFELPILYFRDDAFGLFFTADNDKVTSVMPSHRLHPVRLSAKRAIVGFAAFNYVDTTLGPYGELAVVLPAVFGASPPPILIPALLESLYPDFGHLVMHLPVTTAKARDAGRQEWGYTKFVTDMHFTIAPEFMECRLSEKDQHILTLRVARRGIAKRDKKPLVTFSVKEGNLLKTTMPQRCTARSSIKPKDSFLELGDHPVCDTIRALGISERPFMSRYFMERSLVLPAGRVIQRGVRAFEGYTNKKRKGKHTVVYNIEDV